MQTKTITAADIDAQGNYTGDPIVDFDGHLEIAADLGWVRFSSKVSVKGGICALAGSGIEAGWGIKAGWGIEAGEGIKAGWGIEAGWGIKAGWGIEAGWGIKAGEGIKAGWGIEAGWGIKAGWGIEAKITVGSDSRHIRIIGHIGIVRNSYFGLSLPRWHDGII